jgi:uncharacterized membrane protein YkvI
MVKQQAHLPIAVGVVAIAIIVIVPFLLDHLASVQVPLILVPVVILDEQRTRIPE